MSDQKTNRRSKIYTYFYGKNTIFQQFLILVSFVFLVLSNSATIMERESSSSSNSFLPVMFSFFSWLFILVGIGWIIYKKLSFNKEGEHEVDSELKDCIEEAKKKGMEKLNIVSDQIERVEPVVLNGVAHVEVPLVAAVSGGLLKNMFNLILKIFLKFNKFILALIGVMIYSFIMSSAAESVAGFVILLILTLGGIGFLGYFTYKKYEMEEYVSPKTIESLNRFVPNLVSKLGSDDAVRVSLPAITVYMFGDDQLYMYYQYLDIVTGRVFCEGVHEYFYDDIVGITSAQETKKIYKRCGFLKLFLKDIDYLKESITVVSSGCSHKESYIVDIGKSLLDTKFIGMRNLIRQKKADD